MKKLLILLLIVLLLGALYVTDLLITNSYTLEIVSVNPQPAVADGRSPVTFQARLTRNGRPVEGHMLYALPHRGSLYSARVVTDDQGYAEFVYYPYLANSFIPAKPVLVELYDEDNSVFIYVPVTAEFEIALEQPEEENTGELDITMDDIFGE